jgi:hypothetical protein
MMMQKSKTSRAKPIADRTFEILNRELVLPQVISIAQFKILATLPFG